MNPTKSYKFYFTNKEPGTILGNKNSRNTEETVLDSDNTPIVSTTTEVTPEEGGITVDVELKASGIINGTAKKRDVTGTEEADHGGISVYIPGTSFSAYTDSEGKFSMSGVPQGLHTIRVQYPGYDFCEKENVLLESLDGSIPSCTIEDVLYLFWKRNCKRNCYIRRFSGFKLKSRYFCCVNR
mgnify:CR=1 FL=1